MNSKTGLIIAREFNARVRKKSFIITTILMPVLMIGMMLAPALIMQYSGAETRSIAVIDQSGWVGSRLESDQKVVFVPTTQTEQQARAEKEAHFGVLVIGADPAEVHLYVNGTSSTDLEEAITDRIKEVIETEKLKEHHIENLPEIMAAVHTDVRMEVTRDDREGEKSSSAAIATVVGMVLAFILYMFLIMYGSMVMQSVIEEKNNRVLEVIVSSVSPFKLMLGKILGIAAVAIVQVLIWAVLVVGVSALVMPHLLSPEMVGSVEAMRSGTFDAASTGVNVDMVQAMAQATDLGYMISLFGYLLLFIVGGYLLYSAMFAAVGSAVESVQDAQQLQHPIMIPIMLSVFVMLLVARDPSSPIVFWCSLIPLTSPVVMLARIPGGIPTWEIGLSLALLYASFIGMVWVAGKIFRVGIFMYGKKPTLRELWKWVRYK